MLGKMLGSLAPRKVGASLASLARSFGPRNTSSFWFSKKKKLAKHGHPTCGFLPAEKGIPFQFPGFPSWKEGKPWWLDGFLTKAFSFRKEQKHWRPGAVASDSASNPWAPGSSNLRAWRPACPVNGTLKGADYESAFRSL